MNWYIYREGVNDPFAHREGVSDPLVHREGVNDPLVHREGVNDVNEEYGEIKWLESHSVGQRSAHQHNTGTTRQQTPTTAAHNTKLFKLAFCVGD